MFTFALKSKHMRSQYKLLIEQLDKKTKPFAGTEKVIIPNSGWIYTIRKTLNMSLLQLADRLKMTKQGVKKIEEREAAGTITIKSLRETANALDMHFVYGFVPKQGSFEKLIDFKAAEIAQKIVLRTSNNMKLEDQGNSDERIEKAIKELEEELKREMNRSLWD